MVEDRFLDWMSAYAVGALDARERAELEAHLAEGCRECRAALAAENRLAGHLPEALVPAAPGPTVREQTLDLAHVRSLRSYDSHPMTEIAPGVEIYVHREDPARNMRACLVRVRPGVKIERHRHGGDEVIYVLEGSLRDEGGHYGPGEICHSRAGSVHSEEALPGPDCVCYVLYYGENTPA